MAVNSKLSFTDQVAAFSAAAAYGITQRVVNTWNPYLLRTPRVLVPVQVDALVIRPGQAATQWADCALEAASRHLGVSPVAIFCRRRLLSCRRRGPAASICTGHCPMR